jgi:hypothetical protein
LSAESQPHWTAHSGPSSWYTVSAPPSWKGEEANGTLTLTVPAEGGVLTISSFWLEERPAVGLDAMLDLDRLFPRRKAVRPLKTPTAAEEAVAYEGLSPADPSGKWWHRMLGKAPWRKWRVWFVRRGPVNLIALYVQTGPHDPEDETLATMVVNTLSFSDDPACPPEVFARRVLDLAKRKFPLLPCEPAPDFQIKVGESSVNLFNFYRSYVNSPRNFEAIVLPALTTVVQVQEWGKSQIEPALDDVRGRIMPMLYPEDVWQERFPTFVGTAWVGGLVVLYVVDESQAYWYIRGDLLEKWELSADELHELAMQNLDRYLEEQKMEFTLAGDLDGPRLLMPTRPDAYNSARLLSERFHSQLREIMGGEFAVGAPSRDFFVAVSLDSQETIDHVRRKVEEDYQQMDHPLSERLLLVTRDGVTEYAPWA